ncbi:hypothetical protein Bbelb_030860 [Branchiostoma belcheri]|nr:hypothetical protein Bbelb_030860 [Branchiostoma belcheri]
MQAVLSQVMGWILMVQAQIVKSGHVFPCEHGIGPSCWEPVHPTLTRRHWSHPSRPSASFGRLHVRKWQNSTAKPMFNSITRMMMWAVGFCKKGAIKITR